MVQIIIPPTRVRDWKGLACGPDLWDGKRPQRSGALESPGRFGGPQRRLRQRPGLEISD
jgi:hypothetical protein